MGSLVYRRLAVVVGHLGENSVLELSSCTKSRHTVSLKVMLSTLISSHTKRAVPSVREIVQDVLVDIVPGSGAAIAGGRDRLRVSRSSVDVPVLRTI